MRLKWPGFNDKGTVIIELAADTLGRSKAAIDIDGKQFIAKDELHVTLIGTRLGAIILEMLEQAPGVEPLLEQIFESIDWSFSQTGPVYIMSRNKGKAIQKSIIMLLDMPGLTEFYQQLNTLGLISDATPVPPAHVTLYTHNCPLGIGVPSDAVLKQLTRKILSLNIFNSLRQS